jgi:hypothetical protein
MTSTSVGWVLLDGQGPEATILDHDVFDIQSGVNGAESNTSVHAAAARGAKAIATTSGHKVGAVHVTWTEDLEAGGAELLKSLAELGFDDVHSISLSRAAQAWGIEIGRESEHAKTSLCILEPDAAAIMVIATGAGTVRTAVTESRESGADLVEWLRTVFRKDGWLPESLYLIGAHADLDEAAQLLADALPIPVSDSVDTQLALARGAALATVDQGDSGSAESVEPVTERTWRVPRPKKPAAPAVAVAETVAVPALSAVDTVATQVVETPRHKRPWLVTHAKKLTIGVAAVAVFGAALSLAAGSALNVENASTQAADSEAAGASVTSASVHTVPAPTVSLPVPQLQPLAAEPPPVPPPAPETLSIPAVPAAVVAPEPVAIPAPVPTVSTPPPTPVAVPVAPPPAAPLAAPVAPLPAAPAPIVPPPAAPAPIVPPPAAPAPIAPPPPPPADPAYEPPPPDPVQQVLSPLFSGLP